MNNIIKVMLGGLFIPFAIPTNSVAQSYEFKVTIGAIKNETELARSLNYGKSVKKVIC
jgi:hypothetical protein